jgi:hypothetical protein
MQIANIRKNVVVFCDLNVKSWFFKIIAQKLWFYANKLSSGLVVKLFPQSSLPLSPRIPQKTYPRTNSFICPICDKS